jgi:hypothetical protein
MLISATTTLVLSMNRTQCTVAGLVWLSCLVAAVAAQPSPAPPDRPVEVAPGIFQIGYLTHPRLTECSGVVASRRHPGVFWVHTDGGGPKKQVLFAVRRTGQPIKEYRVMGAMLQDWEDIALDDAGRIYLADTGNNDAQRQQVAVYQVDEPDPNGFGSTVQINRTWPLRFPAKPLDCEALFVWQGYGYLIAKLSDDRRAELYRFALTNAGSVQMLEWVARLPITSPVTGADLSADGQRLAVVAKAGAWLFDINGDPARAGRAPWRRARFKDQRIEGCCFVQEGLLVTAETRQVYLFTDAAFGGHRP